MNIDAFNGTNDSEFLVSFKLSAVSSVADPDDLQIWGGGGGGVITSFFSALGASVWSKTKGLGGGGRRRGGSSPGSATEVEFFDQHLCHFIGK